MSGYPDCDFEIGKLAAEVWGNANGTSIQEHGFGKGQVIWGEPIESILKGMGVGPDCAFIGAAGNMAWIHRTAGDAEIYFVSNQAAYSQDSPVHVPRQRESTRVLARRHRRDRRCACMVRTGWAHNGADPIRPVGVGVRGVPEESGDAESSRIRQGAGESRNCTAAPKIEIRAASYEAKDGAGAADVTTKVAAMVALGETSIPATNDVFGDPAYQHVKQLHIEYTVDGKPMSKAADENTRLELVIPSESDRPAGFALHQGRSGPELRAFRTGTYEFGASQGMHASVEVANIPPAIEMAGPWNVRFPPKLGAPNSITLDTLTSWTQHSDPGVRYFSGTAEYEKEIDIPKELLGPETVLYLDLGVVREIAEVTLNGKDLGIWWKPPFSADVSSIAKPGANTLKVRVTNLWVNRLIGDEQYPDDCDWNGKHLKRWPDWFVDHQPRPSSERITFTTWKHFNIDSTLVDSGLLGPVLLRPGRVLPIQPK